MNWSLHYILQGLKPNIFEKLATSTHDIELSMAAKEKRLPTCEVHKDEDIKELHSRGNMHLKMNLNSLCMFQ